MAVNDSTVENQLALGSDPFEKFASKLSKYERLVWFARSHPPDDTDYWNSVHPEIKRGALNEQSRVEEMFPDDTDQLKCSQCSDWSHGFNSGVLAGLRYALAYADDPNDAEEMFPELDT